MGKPKEPDVNVCIACKRAESPAVLGARFHAKGENGMIISVWMCDRCAIPLGPDQGPITLDDPTTRV